MGQTGRRGSRQIHVRDERVPRRPYPERRQKAAQSQARFYSRQAGLILQGTSLDRIMLMELYDESVLFLQVLPSPTPANNKRKSEELKGSAKKQKTAGKKGFYKK